MKKLYTDDDYFRMACEANEQGKKLVKVQEEKPFYDDEDQEIGTETVESLEIVDNPENFERCFFETSLGFVRRKVHMQTGEYKDFLGDMVAGLNAGMKILTYTRSLEQNEVIVTDQFIQECITQYQKDFGQNE